MEHLPHFLRQPDMFSRHHAVASRVDDSSDQRRPDKGFVLSLGTGLVFSSTLLHVKPPTAGTFPE